MSGQRTWWHLADLGRKPNDYDIATTRLLYYTGPAAWGSPEGGRGFEVSAPLADWYRVHQRERPLVCADWDLFRDPRETTYTRYTELQRDREVQVAGMLAAADDRQLSSAWMTRLDRIIGPLRYPVHGLQMIASYIGSMAPGGRIVVACLLQSADEMRRVQCLAQRTRMLQYVRPSFAAEARAQWQDDPRWQPLRELVERLLVVYDWDEALVALDLAVKPAFDETFGPRLAALARSWGDDTTQRMLGSLAEDSAWHRSWSTALFDMLRTHAGNAARIDEWTAQWRRRAELALAPFAEMLASEDARTAEEGPKR
jgi:hypothetical protein